MFDYYYDYTSKVEKGEKEYTVSILLPGVKRDDIDVKVESSLITVTAKREKDHFKFGKEPKFSFKTDSSYLDTENINASLAEGILTLTVPIKEKEQARKILIAA